jgi:hypothetical protein
MFNKLFNVNKNNINFDLLYLRKLLEDPNIKQNEIIKSAISTNRNILKIHKSIILNINVACVRIEDMKYFSFLKKIIDTMQEQFKRDTEMIHITGSSNMFQYIFGIISIFLDKDLLQKIKME